MGKKYGSKLRLANFLIILFQLLLVCSAVFAIIVTYFPNLDPKAESIVGFWKGISNNLSTLGIISISIIGFNIIASIILIISYNYNDFTMKLNKYPNSLIISLIFFNCFVLLIGLIDKQNLYGDKWYSLLFKEIPQLKLGSSTIIDFNSFSFVSYIYWGVIGLYAIAAFLLWVGFLKIVFVPKEVNVIINNK